MSYFSIRFIDQSRSETQVQTSLIEKPSLDEARVFAPVYLAGRNKCGMKGITILDVVKT